MHLIGLMSGTSADGVDAAVVDIDGRGVRLVAFETLGYSRELRAKVLELCRPESARLEEICHYNFVLGEVFAEALIRLCRRSGVGLSTIDLIGSHGQTIYHSPAARRHGRRAIRSTLQIGEPSVIAQRTGVTTVADFRPRDMAAGGQGAPLSAYADYVLFRHGRVSRAIQNIGGIANVTFLPAGCRLEDVVAFDTGPGNMVIDRIAAIISGGKRRYDRNGQMAAKGRVNEELLGEMLGHGFLRRRPPKTTGREEFGVQYSDAFYQRCIKEGLCGADIIATATTFTAASIAQAYGRFGRGMPEEVILCGGGAHNVTLVRMLRERLKGVKIRPMDEFGISVDAKEAVSFAILAHATVRGLPGNVPGATGADEPVVLGKIVPA